MFRRKVAVFEDPEDYHALEDPALGIDEKTVLVIRNCGPSAIRLGGGGEHAAASALLKKGVSALPTIGDGRQSGTSGSPSILGVSPEAAVGGGLALLKDGDPIRIDLNTRKVDVLIPAENSPPGAPPGRRRAGARRRGRRSPLCNSGAASARAIAWSRRRCI